MSTSPNQTEEDLSGNAYHEAGHAVVGACLGHRLQNINLRSMETSALDISGGCRFVENPSLWVESDHLTVGWAGNLAELKLRRAKGWDEKAAARGLQADWDLMEKRVGGIDSTSLERIQDAKSRSEKLVDQHWRAIETLVDALLRDECIDGNAAHAIIGL